MGGLPSGVVAMLCRWSTWEPRVYQSQGGSTLKRSCRLSVDLSPYLALRVVPLLVLADRSTRQVLSSGPRNPEGAVQGPTQLPRPPKSFDRSSPSAKAFVLNIVARRAPPEFGTCSVVGRVEQVTGEGGGVGVGSHGVRVERRELEVSGSRPLAVQPVPLFFPLPPAFEPPKSVSEPLTLLREPSGTKSVEVFPQKIDIKVTAERPKAHSPAAGPLARGSVFSPIQQAASQTAEGSRRPPSEDRQFDGDTAPPARRPALDMTERPGGARGRAASTRHP